MLWAGIFVFYLISLDLSMPHKGIVGYRDRQNIRATWQKETRVGGARIQIISYNAATRTGAPRRQLSNQDVNWVPWTGSDFSWWQATVCPTSKHNPIDSSPLCTL